MGYTSGARKGLFWTAVAGAVFTSDSPKAQAKFEIRAVEHRKQVEIEKQKILTGEKTPRNWICLKIIGFVFVWPWLLWGHKRWLGKLAMAIWIGLIIQSAIVAPTPHEKYCASFPDYDGC